MIYKSFYIPMLSQLKSTYSLKLDKKIFCHIKSLYTSMVLYARRVELGEVFGIAGKGLLLWIDQDIPRLTRSTVDMH